MKKLSVFVIILVLAFAGCPQEVGKGGQHGDRMKTREKYGMRFRRNKQPKLGVGFAHN